MEFKPNMKKTSNTVDMDFGVKTLITWGGLKKLFSHKLGHHNVEILISSVCLNSHVQSRQSVFIHSRA